MMSLIPLWDVCFGHLNNDNLHVLRKNPMISLPMLPKNLGQYEACILRKDHKKPFLSSTCRESRKLELIHSNLRGSMFMASTNGDKYIMNFIDDYIKMS